MHCNDGRAKVGEMRLSHRHFLQKRSVIVWLVGKSWHDDHGKSVILGRMELTLPIRILYSVILSSVIFSFVTKALQ